MMSSYLDIMRGAPLMRYGGPNNPWGVQWLTSSFFTRPLGSTPMFASGRIVFGARVTT